MTCIVRCVFDIGNQQKTDQDLGWISILLVLILENETLPVDSSPKSTSVATASANRSEILLYLNNLHFIIIKILLSHFMTCRELTFQDVFVMFHWLNYKLLSICSCFFYIWKIIVDQMPQLALAYRALWKPM